MYRSKSSSNQSNDSFYARAHRTFQKQTAADPTYPDRICQQLWAITPQHERNKMEEAFGRDHPGSSLETKGLYYRRLLLERHVMMMMLDKLWQAGSPDETAPPNRHKASPDDSSPTSRTS